MFCSRCSGRRIYGSDRPSTQSSKEAPLVNSPNHPQPPPPPSFPNGMYHTRDHVTHFMMFRLPVCSFRFPVYHKKTTNRRQHPGIPNKQMIQQTSQIPLITTPYSDPTRRSVSQILSMIACTCAVCSLALLIKT